MRSMKLHSPCNSPSVTAREYHIHAGKTKMAASLKKQFPGEEEAIDKFMKLIKVYGQDVYDVNDCRYCSFENLNAHVEKFNTGERIS